MQTGQGEASRTLVEALLAKGVGMPNPATVTIGAHVDPDRISPEGVVIHPGCRIDGAQTVLSAGVILGAEGPVTLSDCRLGPEVELKGGYAAKSVFLRGANLGLGHHVREGSLLEEEAGGAHCVGLKQTILFPFVTLGSLINFCDALMAGGTSRKDHSEVGSSYIHFNFTPGGDKTTPSMFGDVPHGVMLDRPAIFLGGQGGSVGPVTVGFGSVVAAGTVLREDVGDGQLVMVAPPPSRRSDYRPGGYKALRRIVGKNLSYLASLQALEAWYRVIRRPFFAAEELGELVYEGALEMLASARTERVSRLTAMLGKVEPSDDLRTGLRDGIAAMGEAVTASTAAEPPAELLSRLGAEAAAGTRYVAAIQGLAPELAASGSAWLASCMEASLASAYDVVPAARPEPAPQG